MTEDAGSSHQWRLWTLQTADSVMRPWSAAYGRTCVVLERDMGECKINHEEPSRKLLFKSMVFTIVFIDQNSSVPAGNKANIATEGGHHHFIYI